MTTTEPAARLFQTLHHVARTVNSSLDIMQVLQTVVVATAEAMDARACSLRLLGPDGKHLMFGAACGLSPAYRAKGPVLLSQSEIDDLALHSGKTLVIEDAASDPRFQYRDEAREEGIVSVLVTPLKVQDQAIGVLRVYSGIPDTFVSEERELAEAIASLSALAIENARLYERLNRNYQAALEFDQREFD